MIRNQFLSGSDAHIEAMSRSLGMNKCRLTSPIRLSHLAPEIVGALLAGRHPIELTPTRLLRLSKNLPHDWKEHRRFLGFAASTIRLDMPGPNFHVLTRFHQAAGRDTKRIATACGRF